MHLLKGNEMDKTGLVEKGVRLCADAETKLAAAYAAVLKLQAIPVEAYPLGMIGKLESQKLKWGILAAAGLVSEASEKIFEFHARGTEVAQAHGVDVPQPMDGGGGR